MTEELKVIEGGVTNAVLKSLSVTGFKSFVHPTHLEFAPGITAIIGPNGSGKSNFADAIRWALGENNARVLRAKKNEELIFGGSETRKALSHAEALLQLDNSSRRLPIDFTEIEVGRRLFRNGEAEYLVNRSRVRLRDLQDLLAGANLADNPFVVIGQGLVDQILALRPADRRTVIEEAAGTRRLNLRREEALTASSRPRSSSFASTTFSARSAPGSKRCEIRRRSGASTRRSATSFAAALSVGTRPRSAPRPISEPTSRRRSSASTRRSSGSRTTSRKASRRPRAPTTTCVRRGRRRSVAALPQPTPLRPKHRPASASPGLKRALPPSGPSASGPARLSQRCRERSRAFASAAHASMKRPPPRRAAPGNPPITPGPRKKRRHGRALRSPKRGPPGSRPSARISCGRATRSGSETRNGRSWRAMRSSPRARRAWGASAQSRSASAAG